MRTNTARRLNELFWFFLIGAIFGSFITGMASLYREESILKAGLNSCDPYQVRLTSNSVLVLPSSKIGKIYHMTKLDGDREGEIWQCTAVGWQVQHEAK